MDADLILCDHAEAVNGKLYINGGGWNVLFAPGVPVSMSLAIVLDVGWNEANVRHALRVELRTADGELVETNGQGISIPVSVEVGRPPGIKPGSTLVTPMALGFQGIVFGEGGYVWHLLAGEIELARRAFQVSQPPNLTGLQPPGG
jgi:hypothetical protein